MRDIIRDIARTQGRSGLERDLKRIGGHSRRRIVRRGGDGGVCCAVHIDAILHRLVSRGESDERAVLRQAAERWGVT